VHSAPTEDRQALDFIVIGAQKSGTTSLHHYLKGHPELRLPLSKEAPFFDRPQDGGSLERFVAEHFGDAPGCRGKVTPHYMMGGPGNDVARIAERISLVLPRVRLVALLRDPVERAHSHYRMSVRRQLERRSFEQAVRELLEPEALREGREAATETNSYLAAGEYGRILSCYLEQFSREQLLVLPTATLEARPEEAVREVLLHVGVDASYRPANLGKRYFQGGTRERLPRWASRPLFAGLRALLPLSGSRSRSLRTSLYYWFEHWNTAPEEQKPVLTPRTRSALEAHFARDAEVLTPILGATPPWITRP
jgi:hypothetical protein